MEPFMLLYQWTSKLTPVIKYISVQMCLSYLTLKLIPMFVYQCLVHIIFKYELNSKQINIFFGISKYVRQR